MPDLEDLARRPLVSRQTHPYLIDTPIDQANTAEPGSTAREGRKGHALDALARKMVALVFAPVRILQICTTEARRTQRAHLGLDWAERKNPQREDARIWPSSHDS